MGIFRRIYNSFFHTYTTRDLSQWEHFPETKMPIYGVYHVMMDIGWEPVVAAQITTLKESGLLDATKKLYLSCVTNNEASIEHLKDMIGSDKVEIIAQHQDPTCYEYPALEFIKQLSEKENALVYYFHTKGITYQSLTSKDKRFLAFKRKIEAWRELLEYFIFTKWKVAVNTLSNGYDTYGCYRWPPKNYKMYSGSFWWARTDFVRTLPNFDPNIISNDRFYSETWLFQKPNRQFSAFDSIVDFYFVYVPHSIYTEGKKPFIDRFKFVITYNFRKIEKHIFGYNYKKVNQKRFQKLKEKI